MEPRRALPEELERDNILSVADYQQQLRCTGVNPIHTIGNSLKKQKPCTKILRLVLNLHIKSHKLFLDSYGHYRVYSVNVLRSFVGMD